MRAARTRGAVAALSIGAMLTLAACGGGEAQSDSGDDTLLQLDSAVPTGLDPDGPSANEPAALQAGDNLLEPLVDYPYTEKDGVMQPDFKVAAKDLSPALAESFTQEGNKWTFKLRTDAVSCAGNPLTADDIIYTFERAFSASGASPTAAFLATVGGIGTGKMLSPDAGPADKKLAGEVVKVDDHTVEINQTGPNPLFPSAQIVWAARVFDSKEMKKHATPDDPWSHKHAQTTDLPSFGPYCLDSWKKGSEITFKANPKYYRGEPDFKKVVVRQVPADSERASAVVAGQADIATALTPPQYDQVSKGAKSHVLSATGLTNLRLGINFKYAPFDGPQSTKLRQAIAYALPYESIAKENYLGKAKQMKGLSAPSNSGFKEVATYSTDLKKAEQLMAEAGFPGGKGIDPKSPGLKLTYIAEEATLLQPIANTIKTSLGKIGIPISLNPQPQAQYASSTQVKFDLGMWLDNQNRPLDPDVGYHSLLSYVSQRGGALQPATGYDNPKFDALYVKSSKTVGDERQAVLDEMQELLMEDLPFIPVVQLEDQMALSKRIKVAAVTTSSLHRWFYLKK